MILCNWREEMSILEVILVVFAVPFVGAFIGEILWEGFKEKKE